MADLDETPTAPTNASPTDLDLSDEVQDFRFLAALSSTQTSLPKRGEKDFEPHGTSHQQNVLDSSRAAMHAALSSSRIHLPKSHVIGHFDRGSGMVAVESSKGGHFKSMGRSDREGRVWLWPEEALYLLERGTLDVRWAGRGGTEQGREFGEEEEVGDNGERGLEGLPFSLQSGYAELIGRHGLTLERYNVYAGLRRTGYSVLRAEGWDGGGESFLATTSSGKESGSIFQWLYNILTTEPQEAPLGPVVQPGLYRSYKEVYRRLDLIPYYDPTKPPDTASQGQPATGPDSFKLRPCYNVYKPRPDFKKTAPGEPDFRIAVINARETSVPNFYELDGLFASTPYTPPRDGTQLYQKLKFGYRNVILAIVDTGIVSYLRIADAGFGKERLYERQAIRGGKRGGFRGRGRGRGQGRGR